MESNDSKICCARCTKPIEGNRSRIGQYTYGDCCIAGVDKEIQEQALGNYVKPKK